MKSFSLAGNGTHWRWQGIQLTFCPEPKLNKELKVQKMYKSSSRNFQPGLLPNSEQKADEMHVSPAIANAIVACCTLSSTWHIMSHKP
ncbi:MAG TPA: hypothetical protein VF270_13850 [Ignavibacteriaceae bacterium]